MAIKLLKFADDITLNGVACDGNELAYGQEETQQVTCAAVTTWILFRLLRWLWTFRRRSRQPLPLMISGTAVTQSESLKFLEITIS